MLQPDPSNTVFQLAANFVNNTSRHLFLTGKAGTGKTTFLKYIKEHTTKKAVVVAPTGVAAINAAGVTMHSFFQLPFGPFIPAGQRGFSGSTITDKHSLLKNIRFGAEKRELLQELELLIIDEVSMVRCDMLDAMDCILRHFRKQLNRPFGGVQVLYIGDMYQLPPVVPANEWEIISQYYESPFFFHAKVIAEAPPLYIELKKIYRQNEQQFIDVLNRVRHNMVTPEDFNLLNSRYLPVFNPPATEKYITLTTHNRMADTINAAELEKLGTPLKKFTGVIEGDFSDKALPTDMLLQLKEGAQVMFIKNDSTPEKRYFNGKIVTVKRIEEGNIFVSLNNDDNELELEKETWRNIRYTLNKESDRLEEEELGSFTQYPIRLAWAITIHKSQGLTFERAIIDAGSSFAAGQVYVAFSRCTSLNGMVLLSKIHPSGIATDERVVAFSKKEMEAGTLSSLLEEEQQQYQFEALLETFNWKKPLTALYKFRELVPGKKLPDTRAAIELSNTLLAKATEQSVVAEKFQQPLRQLLQQTRLTNDTALLEERAGKAITWFANAIVEDLLLPLQEHIASLKYGKLKKYMEELALTDTAIRQHLRKLTIAGYGDIPLCKNKTAYQQYLPAATVTPPEKKANIPKPVKGSSQAESLSLFRKGTTIADIAKLRNLAESTISGHLAMFVRTGELDVHELVTEEKISIILPLVKESDGHAITPLREKLGSDFSFSEIRSVLNYWHWLKDQEG